MKVLRCKDVGFDCPQEIRGQNEEEVLQQAAQHAQDVHHMQVTPEVAEKVKSLIREE
jgi:predicted small metal-binding protein